MNETLYICDFNKRKDESFDHVLPGSRHLLLKIFCHIYNIFSFPKRFLRGFTHPNEVSMNLGVLFFKLIIR